VAVDVSHHLPAPQSERLAEQARRGAGVVDAGRLAEKTFEDQRVHLLRPHPEQVSGRADPRRMRAGRRQLPAQSRHCGVQRIHRIAGQPFGIPDGVDELVGPHHLPGPARQGHQQCPLPGAPDRHKRAVAAYPHGAQEGNLHDSPPLRAVSLGLSCTARDVSSTFSAGTPSGAPVSVLVTRDRWSCCPSDPGAHE
jgi:hypothetical protein